MRSISVRVIVPVALIVAAAACSKSNSGSSGSPTAPSSTSTAAPAPAAITGASISGVVVTGSAASAQMAAFDMRALAVTGRVTVSVSGTSISTTTDDSGNFTLQNVPTGTQTLSISGSGISAQVTLPAVSTNDQVRVTVRVNGNSATLDDDEVESPDKVEIEGQISSVTGASSAGATIVVGRMNTSVYVPASASITKGATAMKPNDLVTGLRVHVRATKSGTTLTATTVIVQTSNPGSSNDGSNKPDNNDATEDVNFSGAVAGLPGGTCPTITFTAGGTKVTTNASTKFDSVTCSTLANGDTVKGEGKKQTDGSILASEIEKTSGSSSSGGNRGRD